MQELEKAHKTRKLKQVLIQLHDFGLLPSLFPALKSVSLSEIKKRVEPLEHFPHLAPLIAFLLELFPDLHLQQRLDLCKYLKLSNIDAHFIPLLDHAQELTHRKRVIELMEWAYFYSNPYSSLCLQIIAAHFDELKRVQFFQEHKHRTALLQPDIDRIVEHKPIIQAKDLLKEGILAGKSMGLLLKEAERIAINQRLTDQNLILEQLKNLPEWQK